MKNLFRPKWLPVLTLCAGLVGIALRLWLFSTGIDKKGLLLPQHPANTACYILAALTFLAVFLCLRTVPKKVPYRGLFPPSPFSAAGCWIAAAGIGFTVITELSNATDTVTWVCALLGALSAAALAALGVCRLKGRRPNPVFHSLVTLFLILHLVCQYRHWNSETQVSVYFFRLLASVLLMLSAYQLSTLDAGVGNVRKCLFYRYSALFFCCVAIREESPVFYAAMTLWLLFDNANLQFFALTDSMQLPDQVQACMERLNDNGFEAYAVGGCVRDSMLGLTPQDYDLCTNASPRQIRKIFADHSLVRSGEKHGTIGVVIDHTVYEITTFRTEGGYTDSRHPDWVQFETDVTKDLARRDFTVNAMAYSPICGYVDPFGGRRDLEEKILRTVGDPTERFTEDALRILRGARFAAKYHLNPHPETEAAMLRLASTLDTLPRERVLAELSKLLLFANVQDLIRYKPLITQIIPELLPTVGFDQRTIHHRYDVYTHTAHVTAAIEPTPALRWAALLHDVGKPNAFSLDENGCGHFYGHADKSAQIADAVLQRLRASNALREQVVTLIAHHMDPLTQDTNLLRRRLAQLGEETLRQLVALQKADRMGKGVDADDADYEAIDRIISDLIEQNACLKVTDLAINGHDLMAAGFAPGPGLGLVLDALLELVLEERIPNEKEALTAAAAAMKEDTP